MAQNNEAKPLRRSKQGRILCAYMAKDKVFTKKLLTIAPSWGKYSFSTWKKQQILEAIRSGAVKSDFAQTKVHTLKEPFRNFTEPLRPGYDSQLVKEIKQINPQFFDDVKPKLYCTKISIATNRMIGDKQYLLQMAKDNCPLPSANSEMGAIFRRYTRPTEATYDSEFTKQIFSIRKEWFIKRLINPIQVGIIPRMFTNSNQADDTRTQLLQMAKEGKPLPSKKTKLGLAFRRYTRLSRSSYNANFTKQILNIRGEWLSQRVNPVLS